MRMRNLFTIGVLSMLVAIPAFVATTFAAHPETERVDVTDSDTLHPEVAEKVEQLDSMPAEDSVTRVLTGEEDELTRVDVKDTDLELHGPEHDYKSGQNR